MATKCKIKFLFEFYDFHRLKISFHTHYEEIHKIELMEDNTPGNNVNQLLLAFHCILSVSILDRSIVLSIISSLTYKHDN